MTVVYGARTMGLGRGLDRKKSELWGLYWRRWKVVSGEEFRRHHTHTLPGGGGKGCCGLGN